MRTVAKPFEPEKAFSRPWEEHIRPQRTVIVAAGPKLPLRVRPLVARAAPPARLSHPGAVRKGKPKEPPRLTFVCHSLQHTPESRETNPAISPHVESVSRARWRCTCTCTVYRVREHRQQDTRRDKDGKRWGKRETRASVRRCVLRRTQHQWRMETSPARYARCAAHGASQRWGEAREATDVGPEGASLRDISPRKRRSHSADRPRVGVFVGLTQLVFSVPAQTRFEWRLDAWAGHHGYGYNEWEACDGR